MEAVVLGVAGGVAAGVVGAVAGVAAVLVVFPVAAVALPVVAERPAVGRKKEDYSELRI